ncbi:putative membrane protein YdjX, TVP38/TMEM64 family, SNARE-associated domain [Halorhabdus sp. SVX81]|uniref:TVP38/TMEM64 family protein n=1 Tax=Halorhabdus sp. SVX81 TaxID=2978283 RepID=UPI0023D9F54D|nr:VTT domain-containing protein [Halorhabdus sp. SVX81]WEL16517.1 putative membrane protein YdjX, TVP38/TMEM64 family, SNARE-associated domain [Halorhabdus sp. SVX81]
MEPAVRRQLGAIAAVALAAGGVAVFGSLDALQSVVEIAVDSPLAFAAVLIAVYAVRPLVLWPISAVSILVGYGLGIPLGVPVGLLGAVCTSLPAYLLARHAPRERGLFGRLHDRGSHVVDTTGAFRGVAAARLLPLPADVISYGAGLSSVPTRAFVAGTLVGQLPWVLAGVVAGSSMRTLAVEGSAGGLPLVVGAAAVGVLVLASPVIRHIADYDRLPSMGSSGSQ